MNGRTLYNEIDPYAAQWLRNLGAAGHITPGVIDQRSIRDLQPADVATATRAHFFAGIGVWDYALRKAGWPADREVWTGSCPCQPFSAAGKRKGLADDRHLWPEWFRLIRECRPATLLGEQVASAGDWLDLVSRDLEAEGYAFGAVVLGAHSVGAPHIRQRLYFVAHTERGAAERFRFDVAAEAGGAQGSAQERQRVWNDAGDGGDPRGMAHAMYTGRPEGRPIARGGSPSGRSSTGRLEHPAASFWGDADWIPCSDGKLRPVEPGTFPLAHGAPSRVGRLRAYGNALCAETAIAFIRAVQMTGAA